MYLRTTSRTYGDKTYRNHLLVESVQTPRGPRQRTVVSLGDLSPRRRSEWLKLVYKVEEALVGQGDLFEQADAETLAIADKVRARLESADAARDAEDAAVVGVLVDRVETEAHREAGPVHVGYTFWKRLGLDGILEEQGLGARTRALACVLVLNRLIDPKPEHAIPDWVRATALGDMLERDFGDLSEDALYRCMDRLHPHRSAIETALSEREAELFNLDRTVFFYDLTSTYFEGLAKKNPKAKRGYSRDKRPDCKQVVVAMVVNRDGFPLVHEVLDGNTQDRATLEDVLKLMEARVGLNEGQTVVVDRGMAFPENIETLRGHPKKLHYIVATRQPERDQFLEDFEGLGDFTEILRAPSPNNPFQKKSHIEVKRKRLAGETYVLCISSGRAEKDRAIREQKEARMRADLAKLEARIAEGRLVKPVKIGEAIGRIKERYPRAARYYDITYCPETKTFAYPVNAEKLRKAEELDGSYLLRSDREDLDADEVWRTYMLLTRAENAFRDLKSPLALRPIHHQVPRRVDTHIFIAVLAYHLLVAIENTLLARGVYRSWETLRDLLKTHQVCTIVLPTDGGDILRIRKGSTPEAQHKEIYELLKVPTKVIPEVRHWTRAGKAG